MDNRYNQKLEEALQDYLNAVARENLVGGYRLAEFLMRNLKKNELEDLIEKLADEKEDFEPKAWGHTEQPKTPTSIKDLNLKSPLEFMSPTDGLSGTGKSNL